MRRKYSILMDGDQPIDGQWNFDNDNRKPPKAGLDIPKTYLSKPDQITNDVIKLVDQNFPDHFGDLNPFSFVKFPFSVKQEISFGYEDNFMRFSHLEMESYNFESSTDNDYLGDSKYYDSAIISPSIQILIKPKLIKVYILFALSNK